MGECESMTRAQHVVLIGLMGSGKTTAGRALAKLLRRPFVDNDEWLERRTGRTAPPIAAGSGVEALHDIEADVLIEALDSAEPSVIDAAASAPLRGSVRAALRGHFVVYLREQPNELAARISKDMEHGDRPFPDRDPRALLREQFAERDASYRDIADLVIDGNGRSSDALAEAVRQTIVERQRHRASPES